MSVKLLPLPKVDSVHWPSSSGLEYFDAETQRVSDLIDEHMKVKNVVHIHTIIPTDYGAMYVARGNATKGKAQKGSPR